MARNIPATTKLPIVRGARGPAITARPAESKAELEHRLEAARDSIAETAARITGNVEGKIDSVTSTVRGVLKIPDQLQREPVAWSLGALSAGFALGYGLGRARHAKKSSQQALRWANVADEVAGELATFLSTLVPPSVGDDLKSSLGIDLSAALARIARDERIPLRPVRRKSTSAKKPKRSRAGTGRTNARTRRA